MNWLSRAWTNRPSARRRRREAVEAAWARHGLTPGDVGELAAFNVTRDRHVFTKEYLDQMLDRQIRYDQAMNELTDKEGS